MREFKYALSDIPSNANKIYINGALRFVRRIYNDGEVNRMSWHIPKFDNSCIYEYGEKIECIDIIKEINSNNYMIDFRYE